MLIRRFADRAASVGKAAYRHPDCIFLGLSIFLLGIMQGVCFASQTSPEARPPNVARRPPISTLRICILRLRVAALPIRPAIHPWFRFHAS